MHGNIFFELSLLLVATGVISGIIRLLKQPMIIGYIVSGLLLGPYLFNVVHSEAEFANLSQFGIALLLFIIGLGLNPKVIKDVGKAAILVGAGQIVFTVCIATATALLLGFDTTSSFYIAVALAFSSTIIVLKIISDKKETTKLYGRIATGFLLVQDIVATLALIFVAAQSQNSDVDSSSLVTTLAYTSLLVIGLFLVSKYVLPKFVKFLSESQEFLFLFALAWGFGVASLFVKAGLSLEIGALFAGVALSTQIYAQEVSSRLKPLRDFFILIFFIILGAELDLSSFKEAIVPAIIFSLVVIVGNPLIVMTIMRFLGYTRRTNFKTGLTVSQISEFSLIFILLASDVGQVDSKVTSIVTIVALVTIASSTYMMMFDDKLFEVMEKYLRIFEKKDIHKRAQSGGTPDVFLFGYARGGHEFIQTFRKLKKKFVVVDYDPSVADDVINTDVPFIYGDIGDPELLAEINVEDAKVIVSIITDSSTNLFLTKYTHENNPRAIIIVHSDNPANAIELYENGATYVMMPHYIGTEKIGHMMRKNGLKKSDFTPARERHLRYIEKHL